MMANWDRRHPNSAEATCRDIRSAKRQPLPPLGLVWDSRFGAPVATGLANARAGKLEPHQR